MEALMQGTDKGFIGEGEVIGEEVEEEGVTTTQDSIKVMQGMSRHLL